MALSSRDAGVDPAIIGGSVRRGPPVFRRLRSRYVSQPRASHHDRRARPARAGPVLAGGDRLPAGRGARRRRGADQRAGAGSTRAAVHQGADDKAGKNRAHLDIQPPAGTRDETVQRLLAAGATVYEDHRTADGLGWVTMRDPEGNEFCVERSAGERGLPTA
jgi:hypothetical protein